MLTTLNERPTYRDKTKDYVRNNMYNMAKHIIFQARRKITVQHHGIVIYIYSLPCLVFNLIILVYHHTIEETYHSMFGI